MGEGESKSNVTALWRVDQYDNVYDEIGAFRCKWHNLTDEEQELVKLNPLSAR